MRPIAHFVLYNLGLVPAETQTTSAERDCIASHAFDKRKAAEVGVWHGITTCRIAQCLGPSGIVYAVDNYPPGRLGLSLQYYVAWRNTRMSAVKSHDSSLSKMCALKLLGAVPDRDN